MSFLFGSFRRSIVTGLFFGLFLLILIGLAFPSVPQTLALRIEEAFAPLFQALMNALLQVAVIVISGVLLWRWAFKKKKGS
jgi:hypothetical protein